jgi:hypothetical protein
MTFARKALPAKATELRVARHGCAGRAIFFFGKWRRGGACYRCAGSSIAVSILDFENSK